MIELRGEVGLADAAAINSAVRWERHAMLAQRWLRVDVGDMDATTRLAYSRDVAKASSERDKCIRALGLEPSKQSDPWSILDATATTRTEEAGSSENGQTAGLTQGNGHRDEQQDSPLPTCVTSHSEQPDAAGPDS